MPTLPILLKNQRVLLLGGGPVAYHKACVLKDNQIDVSVLAGRFSPEFAALGLAGGLTTKEVDSTDLAPFSIIIDATGDPDVAALLLAERERRFLLLNIVDKPKLCDFYFSSLLNYGRLKIAVSTDGASPTLGQVVRDRIRTLLPEDLGDLVEEKADERARGVIDTEATRQQALVRLARVDLVGCGPGDVELLTLQACRCIGEADIVLYDHLIPQPILDLVPARAERRYVGKQKQSHSMSQEEINRLALAYAQRGLRVARLKSGDPYIFGRGAEEAEFLVKHGVRVRVIPGISSAMAGPAAAGIPLTARGYATNVSIVSAHLAGSRLNIDWLPLLRLSNHTTVVLMGLSFAREIAEHALLAGVPGTTPVAIVSNATREKQRTVATTLDNLAEESRRAARPAVLVFGNVVGLHHLLPKLS
ncbi:MAG TPA: uroporphyrinogen-III C-methyltransferase [Desulfuromonadales bacterium]|nr:uroporphyrinogen-III C-methyltransferase [Desulfuromonadales bacterium]